MSSPAKDVIEYILKDNGKDLIVRIFIPGGTNQLGSYQRMLPRIAGGVINFLPGILSYFPNGSELFLEARPSMSLEKDTTKRKSARKKRKKKSPPTGGRKRNTSKGAAKKAKTTK